ncbi:MAG: hypothetical protein DMF61_07350 [Blastocatellia bacterium AA13]|nr:MAG: hypothetical protein DMF61_07350 [Blastocatellia bacterium AA13]
MSVIINQYDNAIVSPMADSSSDALFVSWLREKGIEGKTIFHWGSGQDHVVERDNYERGNPNEIISVVGSREEHDFYIEFITDFPGAATHYKVMFADIYTLSARMLPSFDLVTLFHLCQSPERKPSAHAPLTDKTLLVLFLSRLNPEGRLLFSKHTADSQRLPGEFIRQRRMAVDEESESLLVCRRTW